MSIDNPAPKGQEDSARGFNPGYGKPRGAALKVLPTPRTRGAIPNWRSTPTLQYSITPRGRIRGRGRRRGRSASRGIDFPRRSLPDVPSSTVRVTQSRGQRLLNHVVNRLGDDLVPDPGRMGGIPEKVLIWVRYHGATMR
jgi:hypothetical protein